MAEDAAVTSSASFSEELAKLMGKGKRHYICNEVEQAVKCFEEATQKLNKEYGQTANECGEAYLYYGKSLIDLARMETGVLGSALKVGEGQDEDISDDDDDDEDDQMETEETTAKDEETVAEKTVEKSEETGEETTVAESADEKVESKGSEEKVEPDTASETTGETTVAESADEKVESKGSEEKVEPETASETTGETTVAESVDKKVESEDFEEKTAEPASVSEMTGETKTEVNTTEAKQETSEVTAGKEEQLADAKSDDKKAVEDEGKSEEETTETAQDTNGNAKGNEEEISTMELAWEILEMARLIYERQESKEARLNLAQTYLKLGEIQMERELFLEAVDEFHKCLEIQQKYLEPDDRLLAETSYNIGLSYSFQSQPKEAKDNYSKALEVIELRMKNIEARLQESDSKGKGKQKALDGDPCVKDRKELAELQDLYPEIKAKIDDAQEMLTSAETAKAAAEPAVQTIAVRKPNSDAAATVAPVSDISHLVKRKRKSEEPKTSENPQPDGPAKKPRQENGTENTNGHDIPSEEMTSAVES